ncbi:MAG TPA: hypothetical protein VN790_09665 [Steroidobacteraceae bacterium]|nr:hypothetical protein [Steroidobacteraceae bacterium]
MGVKRSKAGILTAAVLALAGLGLGGGAWAESHGSSGGHGGGGHPSGAARHGSASHARSYARAGGYRAPAGGFHGQSSVHRQYTAPPAARAGYRASPGGSGGSGGRGAYAPGYGRESWGRPGGWRGYHGPYFGFVAAVPWYAYAFWWNGIPYYVADDTYYLWNDAADVYQIVPPPVDGNDADAGGGGGGPDLSVYPSDGQSPEQQSSDRYECYRWAVDQTGFDPTQPAGGVQPGAASDAQGAYRRAEAACLQGRGYTVR